MSIKRLKKKSNYPVWSYVSQCDCYQNHMYILFSIKFMLGSFKCQVNGVMPQEDV